MLHFVRYLPSREYRRFRSYSDYVRSFAQGLIKESMIRGDGKDMMSVLLRANSSENPNSKMSNDEIIDQISCVLTFAQVRFGFEVHAHSRVQYSPPCRA
jgi:cytochrome P450